MNWLQALILGLIQGLAEYLPISSKSHIELGRVLLNLPNDNNLAFTVFLHGATVLSTLIVFRNDIIKIIKPLLLLRYKDPEFVYTVKLIISMLPVVLVGLFLKEEVSSLFTGNLLLIGVMMLITVAFLVIGHYAKPGGREINGWRAFVIGLAQAFAVLPGISRSGSTICTGMALGIKREDLAKFSFLMVIIPVLGEQFLDLIKGDFAEQIKSIGSAQLITGFAAAFFSGLFACRWMINIVNKGKLIHFAIYCFIVAISCIFFELFYK
jgi:undecaprenyl-diphosphatase